MKRLGGFETLEERQVLSANALGSELLAQDDTIAVGEAATIELGDQVVGVMKGEWIVQFSDASARDDAWDAAFERLSASASFVDLDSAEFGLLRVGDVGWHELREFARAWPAIASIEPNLIVSLGEIPDDPGFGGLWGLDNTGQDLLEWDPVDQQFDVIPGSGGLNDADIDAPEAWEMTTGSTNVVVGVLDSGIDYTHPDLYLNVWLNQGEIPSAFRADLVDIDSDGLITFRDLNNSANWNADNEFLSDLNGNGYIDAGDLLGKTSLTNPAINITTGWEDGDSDGNGRVDDIIGWNFVHNNNDPWDDNLHGTHVSGTIAAHGGNSAGVAGVTWNTQIIPVKFTSAFGEGSELTAGIALNYVKRLKTDFDVNVVATNNSWGSQFATGAFLTNAIQGNSNEGIIFVAAAGNNAGNNDGIAAAFPASLPIENLIAVGASTKHDELAWFSNFGGSSVELVAPGESILSTFPTVQTARMGTGGLSTRYETISGTSMAAPHVTGVIALMAAANPDATLEQLRDALNLGVDFVSGLVGKTITSGRLNAADSLEIITIGGPIIETAELADGERFVYFGDDEIRQTSIVGAASFTFTEELLSSSVTLGNLSLLASGGDGTFGDGNEVLISLSGAVLSQPQGDKIRIQFAGELQPEVYQLTFVGTGGNPLRSLDGDAIYGGADYGFVFEVFPAQGPLESNDWIGEATDTGLVGSGSVTIDDPGLAIGDGYHGALDVDMYQVELTERSTLAVEIDSLSSGLDSYLRLFDSSGNEIAVNDDGSDFVSRLLVTGLEAGTYFIGVSGYGNSGYDPLQRNSGTAAITGGAYELGLSITQTPLPTTGIHGIVGHDFNDDGGLSGSEPGLAGFTVFVDADEDGVLDSGETWAETDSLGRYELNELASGAYEIAMVVPEGWEEPFASGNSQSVTVAANQITDGVNFRTRLELGPANDFIVNSASELATAGSGLSSSLGLRAALDLASDYGVTRITIAASLTYETLNLVKGQLVIDSNVDIVGMGAERFAIDAQDAFRVVLVQENVTVGIQGLSITRGHTTGDGGAIYNQGILTLSDVVVSDSVAEGHGGGIFNSGTLTASNVVIDGNLARNDGGGIRNEGVLTVLGSTISNNHAQGTVPETLFFIWPALDYVPQDIRGGGGISNRDGALVIDESLIDNNSAVGLGGGILNVKPTDTVTITRTTISNNSVTDPPVDASDGRIVDGAGIFSVQQHFEDERPTLVIDASRIAHNIARGPLAGGGISLRGPINDADLVYSIGSSRITNTTIIGNRGERGGGLFNNFLATTYVENCTIANNVAETNLNAVVGQGGGILNFGQLEMSNSTISGNVAEHDGGGIWTNASIFIGASFSGVNLTITDNRVTSPDGNLPGARGGGGLFIIGDYAYLHNSVVAGNFNDGASSFDSAADIGGTTPLNPESYNNLIGIGNHAGLTDGVQGNIVGDLSDPVDAMLGDLADNGGPTWTHALLVGSLAIDAGQTFFPIAADQRGLPFTRIFDGDGDGVATVDIGAYELQRPRVIAVFVGGANEQDGLYKLPSGSGAQLAAVPVGAANRIDIRFSEDVNLDGSELSVVGNFTSTVYAVVFLGYDAATHTASWQLATGVFPADQIVLTLDYAVGDNLGNALAGQWTNPPSLSATGSSAFPSGGDAGAEGGDFTFHFTVLPGDLDRNNKISAADLSVLLANFGQGPNQGYRDGDLSGDGMVSTGDLSLLLNNYRLDFKTWSPMALRESAATSFGPDVFSGFDGAHSLPAGPGNQMRAASTLEESSVGISLVPSGGRVEGREFESEFTYHSGDEDGDPNGDVYGDDYDLEVLDSAFESDFCAWAAR